MTGKFALIIGNTEYTDPGLTQLTAPGRDAEDFARVLRDKDIGAFDEVNILMNQPEYIIREAIDDFFNQKKPDDLLVLYFSGHGVRDELGTLYLAVRNTTRAKLRATGLRSDYIKDAMDQSRSKRQVLILDCCNSGAFAHGTKSATGVSIGTASAFEAGYGRVILTASDSTQFAWEGDKVIGETDNSLFTHFLVEGLEGEADLDNDGRITVDELYDYAYEKVRLATPNQTPSKFSSRQQGEIVLRQNMRIEDIKPVPLPPDLVSATENTITFVREGAVRQLENLLSGKNRGLVRSAEEALKRIAAEDDSYRLRLLAAQILESSRQIGSEQKIEEERKTRVEEERLFREKTAAESKAKEAEKKLHIQAERKAAELDADRLKERKEVPIKAAQEKAKKEVAQEAKPEAADKVTSPDVPGKTRGSLATLKREHILLWTLVGIIGVFIIGTAVWGRQYLARFETPTPTEVSSTEEPVATQPPMTPLSTEIAAPSGTVKVLLIGKPDEDGIDPVSGANIPGVQQLKTMFETAHPSIDMQIINIPWGSGTTGYGPKTEAMIQAQEACVYLMPGAFQYGRRGYLENLDPWIANDPTFEDVWPGDYLEQWHDIGPGNPDSQWALPYSGGNRVIHYDAKLFEDWGVEALKQHPTLNEIEEKAKAMTGINPITGEQNYGYWYQGKYINWQFQAIAHALGATWGQVNADGTWTINWDTPEYLQALEWLVMMSQYAPPGALAADAMPEGFLTDQNVVAIIPEGETGYYLTRFVNDPSLNERFRTTYNLQGSDGKGGLFIADPVTMAASCPNKEAAWEVMKWLTSSPESQKYNFDSGGNLPVIEGAREAIPAIGALVDADAILNQNAFAERRYPWASTQPRFSLQAAIESALAGTLSPKQALEQAQQETEDWLAQQATATP